MLMFSRSLLGHGGIAQDPHHSRYVERLCYLLYLKYRNTKKQVKVCYSGLVVQTYKRFVML